MVPGMRVPSVVKLFLQWLDALFEWGHDRLELQLRHERPVLV